MLTRIFWRCFVVLGLVYALHEAVTGYIENRAFKAHGLVAETDQIYKYDQTVHTRKQRGHSPDVSITNEAAISFMTAENAKITVKKRLPDDVLEKYKRYEQVNIEYLSNEPNTTRWRGEKRDVRGSIMFSLFMLVLTIIMIVTWRSETE
ncbi:hypothetical protein ACO0LC_11210 [Undibacterium sp. JH2W]|uniref:hypothetical protein n=1 Tax=Undibacterium sp. JH2W TaxID=3413037 RepID=UPI003BF04776